MIADVCTFGVRYTDPETGFLYLRARYYDPATAQFLTRDPMAAATRSAYGYVGNDPLNQDDPLGLCSSWNPICNAERVAHSINNDVVKPVGRDVVGKVRAPDYVTFDVGWVIPLIDVEDVPLGIGPGLNVTVTRGGSIYMGPEAAAGLAGPFGSALGG